MTQKYNKPIPSPQGESDLYWNKAEEKELWIRKCNKCDEGYFYPRDISPCCFSKNTEWVQCTGKATLFTYGIVMRAPHPGFVEDIPFVTAIVQLEEGPLMPSNVVVDGIDRSDPELALNEIRQKLSVGMNLEVIFEKITDDLSLPKFRPI